MEEIKKGYESLMADYQRSVTEDNGWSEEECKKSLDWVLARAQKYADWCGVTRDEVLEGWEKTRTYCWRNFYQECNQPDPEKMKGTPVMLYKDWVAKGERLYGKDWMNWKFKCPTCGHVQSLGEFKNAGVDPNYAIMCCASRFNLGGRKDCKWTTGGLLAIGGVYVVRPDFKIILAFAFADEEKEG